jgi:hypothetical protein
MTQVDVADTQPIYNPLYALVASVRVSHDLRTNAYLRNPHKTCVSQSRCLRRIRLTQGNRLTAKGGLEAPHFASVQAYWIDQIEQNDTWQVADRAPAAHWVPIKKEGCQAASPALKRTACTTLTLHPQHRRGTRLNIQLCAGPGWYQDTTRCPPRATRLAWTRGSLSRVTAAPSKREREFHSENQKFERIKL